MPCLWDLTLGELAVRTRLEANMEVCAREQRGGGVACSVSPMSVLCSSGCPQTPLSSPQQFLMFFTLAYNLNLVSIRMVIAPTTVFVPTLKGLAAQTHTHEQWKTFVEQHGLQIPAACVCVHEWPQLVDVTYRDVPDVLSLLRRYDTFGGVLERLRRRTTNEVSSEALAICVEALFEAKLIEQVLHKQRVGRVLTRV